MTSIADTPLADAASSQEMCPVELLWIPLGAGQHVVRVSGRAFEALTAFVQHRPACDLYHSALVVTVPGGRYVIEMTPVPDRRGDQRGVVAEGAVGSAWLGKLRVFRYEIHRWHDGVIPDADQATATTTLQLAPADAQRLLDIVPMVPTPVWGRDELDAGEMWNSNSVTSWLLRVGGVETTRLAPPNGGRAPGWDAGLVVAARTANTA
ncbi:MAG: hypothetical protein ABI862_10760 [Ilumatobacteraceae bacterium]